MTDARHASAASFLLLHPVYADLDQQSLNLAALLETPGAVLVHSCLVPLPVYPALLYYSSGECRHTYNLLGREQLIPTLVHTVSSVVGSCIGP